MVIHSEMGSKNANQILGKAVDRCKKAQILTRRFNNEKMVMGGAAVIHKMVHLLEVTKETEFGELATELQTLDDMIANMQVGVLEELLESVEAIERRIQSYQKTILESEYHDSLTTATLDDDEYTEILPDQVGDEMTSGSSDQSNDWTKVAKKKVVGCLSKNDEVGQEITAQQQQRFMDRLRNFFTFQRIAEERVAIVDPQGKVSSCCRLFEERNVFFRI